MNYSAYTLKQLQDFKSLINQAIRMYEIDNSVSFSTINADIEKNIKDRTAGDRNQLCPDCKKHILSSVINYEGLNILWCKKCGYSFIVDE